MSIRTRLTLWYAGIMFVSLLAMGVLTYREFAPGPKAPPPHGGPRTQEEDDASDFHDESRILFWCGVPSALLALVGGWWLMRKALSPVAVLTRAAERLTEQNLNEKLPHSGNGDEIDRLTTVFNAMTARLDEAFRRIREFTLHASHELKTPLTVLHGEIETALRTDSVNGAQREQLLSQLDEVQRLSKIVDGLTLLTKADAGQVALKPEPLPLDELVRDACADAQILARPAEVRVTLASCEHVEIQGDRHRLRQMLLNLTDNAIKYNQPNGSVEMVLRRMPGGAAEITIANTGPGIPAEFLPRVFDRFCRGDPAHSNAVEGCGLGLSISQWIATAHHGTIEIESAPARLTRVTVRLPLVQPTGLNGGPGGS